MRMRLTFLKKSGEKKGERASVYSKGKTLSSGQPIECVSTAIPKQCCANYMESTNPLTQATSSPKRGAAKIATVEPQSPARSGQRWRDPTHGQSVVCGRVSRENGQKLYTT